jgi:uncharacterized protein (AIM24 family)
MNMLIQELGAYALDTDTLATIHAGQGEVSSRRWFGGGKSFWLGLFGEGRGTVHTTVDTHEVIGDNLTIDSSRVLDRDGKVLLSF